MHIHLGPLSVSHWINDALMALFFLLVGLEIKREMLDGQLATWSRRVLPGIAATGGMLVPALIYVALNSHSADALRGWAIPTATDIAFALGVSSLIGNRVPASLKIFLAALAIIDDLGAVLIIALFYTTGLSLIDLAGAGLALVLLSVLNRRGVLQLWPYLVLGGLLWVLVYRSGIHATLAGVALALTVPLRASKGTPDSLANSPLHRLEHGLSTIVPFVVVPIFGFANAGVSFVGLSLTTLVEPLTLGVGGGLLLGKLVGVFGSVALAVRLGFAELPAQASWSQMFGVALLCGDRLYHELVHRVASLHRQRAAAGSSEARDHFRVGDRSGPRIDGPAQQHPASRSARTALDASHDAWAVGCNLRSMMQPPLGFFSSAGCWARATTLLRLSLNRSLYRSLSRPLRTF